MTFTYTPPGPRFRWRGTPVLSAPRAIPLVVDPCALANRLYFLNPQTMAFWVHDFQWLEPAGAAYQAVVYQR